MARAGHGRDARCNLHPAAGWPPKMYTRDGEPDQNQGRQAMRPVIGAAVTVGTIPLRWPAPLPRARKGTLPECTASRRPG